MTAQHIPRLQVMIRLDGLSGKGVVIVAVFQPKGGSSGRWTEYTLLDRPLVQARVQTPPDQQVRHPDTGTSRSLSVCGFVPIVPGGPLARVRIATHPHRSRTKPVVLTPV